jgi:hypothetical protein
MTTVATALNREALADRYRQNRQRSRQLFDLVSPEAYYSRPISLRHPIVFYEGHLPAFSLNTLVKKGLGRGGVDERLERLFARGIDPEDEASASESQRAEWPSRDQVRGFADECDALILEALANAPLEQPGHPLLHEAQAVYAILEHEAMHQETMLYMWHQLPYEQKQAPADASTDASGTTPITARVALPAGRATPWRSPGRDSLRLGQRVPRLAADVPAFEIDVHDVTNEQFMDFVDAGGYRDARLVDADGLRMGPPGSDEHPRFWTRANGTWKWRGMFEQIDLPAAWPVYVSQARQRRMRVGRARVCRRS